MSVGWLDNPEFRIFAVLVAFAIELDMIEISIVAEGVVLVLLNVAHDATVEIVDVKFQVVSVDFGKGALQLVGRMMVRHTPRDHCASDSIAAEYGAFFLWQVVEVTGVGYVEGFKGRTDKGQTLNLFDALGDKVFFLDRGCLQQTLAVPGIHESEVIDPTIGYLRDQLSTELAIIGPVKEVYSDFFLMPFQGIFHMILAYLVRHVEDLEGGAFRESGFSYILGIFRYAVIEDVGCLNQFL